MIELFPINSVHNGEKDYWQVTKNNIENNPEQTESDHFRSKEIEKMYECAEQELTANDFEMLIGTEFDPPFN